MKKALKNRKGFTLIEIIVVLVILAILAAALIPSMIGFVEEARGKALVAEARSVYIAGQAIATELTTTGTGTGTGGQAVENDITTEDGLVRLRAMLAPDILIGSVSSTTGAVYFVDMAGGIVKKMTYAKIVGGKTFTVTLEPPKPATIVRS